MGLAPSKPDSRSSSKGREDRALNGNHSTRCLTTHHGSLLDVYNHPIYNCAPGKSAHDCSCNVHCIAD